MREASTRVLGQRHYDVQIMGGGALHLGNIAEMRTGEGKTLVSTLPAYLNALSGEGVHVVTVNDYLTRRDSEWMGRVHKFLGLTVGLLYSDMSVEERKAAYAADITYGTNTEFGFDYLRDNMAPNKDYLVQRGHVYAIVDEVDSILIDEARTPLIISGNVDGTSPWYAEFASIVSKMVRGVDYEVDEKDRAISMNEAGIARIEKILGIGNLYDPTNTPLIAFLHNAVKARELFVRDRDYIVTEEGEVLIVDEHTGRILFGRRFNDSLHQALEAKEQVPVKTETQILSTVTLQNYFRLYDKLGGMTGTAGTEAAEFSETYGLGVVVIPTNRPVKRVDHQDLIYRTRAAKDYAVLEEVQKRHDTGQPILIGTASVEGSERFSALLLSNGIPHNVLNAKQNKTEAEVVAEAGRLFAVTVATNMAGRGTDIMLGGNAEHLTALAMHERGISEEENPDLWAAVWPEVYASVKEQVEEEAERIRVLGGLYVVGTERHDARRIDNQLRGRAGRQGDPGETRFFLSLEDHLMRLFKTNSVDAFLRKFNFPDDVPLESKIINNAVTSAQAQQEGLNFEARRNVLKYDEVMNRQRILLYGERTDVLTGVDLKDQIRQFLETAVRAAVVEGTAVGYAEDWDLDVLWESVREVYPVRITVDEVLSDFEDIQGLTSDYLAETLVEDALDAYEAKEESLGADTLRIVERDVLLYVIDQKWRDHLYEMQYLREGIGLRSYAQRDPLVEYEREGYDLFAEMMASITEETIKILFAVERVEDVPVDASVDPDSLQYSAPSEPGSGGDEDAPTKRLTPDEVVAEVLREREVTPNEFCPCGSGKKYKRCHGSPSFAG